MNPFDGPIWNGWGGTTANWHFQPADQARLSPDAIPRLRLKWAFGFPNATMAGSQPTVAGGRLFIGSQNGTVYSLDAKTGCIHWTFAAYGQVKTAITIGPRRTESGVAAFAAYFGDQRGNAYAIDAATGELLWARHLDDHPRVRLTGAPVLHEGRLYVPVSSIEEGQVRNSRDECCTFRGSLVAMDAATGQVIWKTYTIPEKARARGPNAAGVMLWGPAGASIWSSPTIDAKRGVVYVATGNAYSEPQPPTSDAVIAIDMKSGAIKWVKQATAKDVYIGGCPGAPNCPPGLGPDYDFGSSSMLVRLRDGRDALVIAQKSGMAWALDPDKRGAVIWEYRAGKGSMNGGTEWGSAVDGELAYFPVSDAVTPEPGGLHAVDLTSGRRVWVAPPQPLKCQAPGCIAAQTAAITVIPGAVFSGAHDGAMRAYSTKDGSILWEFDTNREFATVNGVKATGASIGGPAPTIVDGMLYFNSGGESFMARPGNVLLAFGVE